MTLVFLNVTGSLGGAEQVLLTLLKELRRLRPEWRLVVIAGESGPLLRAVGDLGCSAEILEFPGALKALGDWGVAGSTRLVLRIAQTLPAIMQYRNLLRRKLRLFMPEVVQSNGFKMHVLAALATPRAVPHPSRLLWHVHDFVSNRAAMRTLLGWCSGRPSAIVAISSAVATDLKSVVRQPSKVQTIWNAIDLSRYSAIPRAGGEEVRIGLVATFARWKGHEVFLRALSLLPKALPWRAYIVGGEIYSRAASQYTEAELRGICARLGLEDRVEFTGFLTDPAPFVETLDIVVHASTEPEPFGLAIAEGMAAGCAVVTSSKTLIADGIDGLTHAPGDAADLARVLEQLVRDPALRQRLGTAARAAAEQRFQPERMAREFIALYEATS